MLDRDPSARLDLMDLMDTDFFTMEDDEYKKLVDDFCAEFHRSKEEQKTQETIAPPVYKNSNAGTASPGRKKMQPVVKKDSNPPVTNGKVKKIPITK